MQIDLFEGNFRFTINKNTREMTYVLIIKLYLINTNIQKRFLSVAEDVYKIDFN